MDVIMLESLFSYLFEDITMLIFYQSLLIFHLLDNIEKKTSIVIKIS